MKSSRSWAPGCSRWEYFKDSTIITDDVLAKIEELAELAPLHSQANAMRLKRSNTFCQTSSLWQFLILPSTQRCQWITTCTVSHWNTIKNTGHGNTVLTVLTIVSFRNGPLNFRQTSRRNKNHPCHIEWSFHYMGQSGQSSILPGGPTPLAGVTMGTRSGISMLL